MSDQQQQQHHKKYSSAARRAALYMARGFARACTVQIVKDEDGEVTAFVPSKTNPGKTYVVGEESCECKEYLANVHAHSAFLDGTKVVSPHDTSLEHPVTCLHVYALLQAMGKVDLVARLNKIPEDHPLRRRVQEEATKHLAWAKAHLEKTDKEAKAKKEGGKMPKPGIRKPAVKVTARGNLTLINTFGNPVKSWRYRGDDGESPKDLLERAKEMFKGQFNVGLVRVPETLWYRLERLSAVPSVNLPPKVAKEDSSGAAAS